MEMRDRENQDLVVRCGVDQAVWKTFQLTAANGCGQGMPRGREALDALDRVPDLVLELIAKANSLSVVVTNRID